MVTREPKEHEVTMSTTLEAFEIGCVSGVEWVCLGDHIRYRDNDSDGDQTTPNQSHNVPHDALRSLYGADGGQRKNTCQTRLLS